MIFKPYNYQAYTISRIIHQNNIALWLDMGMGKTVSTLTAIKDLIYNRFSVNKVLIIAPKKVAESTWDSEINKWEHLKMLTTSKILGNKTQRLKGLSADADIYITSRDNVVWLVEHHRNYWPYDMVVIDESSNFKSHKAKRVKALVSVLPHINRVVELTGTPSPNGYEDLWAQIYLLDRGERLGTCITHYRNAFFVERVGGANGRTYRDYKLIRDSEREIQRRISDLCVTLKSEDYLTLPDFVLDPIPIEFDEAVKKAYKKFERDLLIDVDGNTIEATSAAALSNKLCQFCNGAVYDENRNVIDIHDQKVDALEEVLESLQNKNVLLFYQFQHDIPKIKKLLKTKFKDRKVSMLKTAQDIDDWNAGKINVLITHPASAAYGLNLQHGGSHCIWYGLTWNLEQVLQANKRLHRTGQKETVFAHILYVKGARDEDVMKSVETKEISQKDLMDSLKARIEEIKKEGL